MNLCLQSHNILMDEHNEYLLQVYGGVFEILSESSARNRSYCRWFAYILENSDSIRPKITNHGKII